MCLSGLLDAICVRNEWPPKSPTRILRRQPSPHLPERRSDSENGPLLARGKPAVSGRWSGYCYLLWVRLLELKREPEIVFWVFGFPLLLSLGLGIAFRNKPADKAAVAVIAGQNAAETASRLGGLADKRSSIRAVVLDREAALKGFRLWQIRCSGRTAVRWQVMVSITILRVRKASSRA